jgi:hypothetical protein
MLSINMSPLELLNKAKETPTSLSKSESLELMLLELLRVVSELATVEKFLDEAALGKIAPGTTSSLKLTSIGETIDLLAVLYPYLKEVQREEAYLEACELFGVDPETGLGEQVKN